MEVVRQPVNNTSPPAKLLLLSDNFFAYMPVEHNKFTVNGQDSLQLRLLDACFNRAEEALIVRGKERFCHDKNIVSDGRSSSQRRSEELKTLVLWH